MSTAPVTHHYLEVTRQLLRLVTLRDAAIVNFREAPVVHAPGVLELLADLGTEPNAAELNVARAAVLPGHTFWHRATGDEVSRHRGAAELAAFAAARPHGFAGEIGYLACDAAEGEPVHGKSEDAWYLAATTGAAIRPQFSLAGAPRTVRNGQVYSATMAHLGAIRASLAGKGGARVLLWELGDLRSNFLLVTASEVEAVIGNAFGYSELLSIVQAELGLKIRGAAERLLANDGYDFSGSGPRIVERVAAALQPVLAELPVGSGPAALHCPSFLPLQSWFTGGVADCLGLAPWTPDLTELLSRLYLKSVPPEMLARLTPSAAGLLQLASADARGSQRWSPPWLKTGEPKEGKSGGSGSPFATHSPFGASNSPFGTGSPFGVGTRSATQPVVLATTLTGADARGRVAVKPASAPAEAATARATDSAATSALAIAADRQLSETQTEEIPGLATVAVPEPKRRPKLTPDSDSIPPARIGAGATMRAKDEDGPKWPAPKSAPSGGDGPAGPAKKFNRWGIIGGALVLAALLACAGKFYFDARTAEVEVESRAAQAARDQAAAVARLKELQQKAEAEATQVKRQAELDRETAIAQARQQAEEQTKAQLTSQFAQERLAKFPGALIVTTEPSGATVAIDDEPARTSPLTLRSVAPGEHRVAVALKGYEPIATTATIQGGQTTDLGLLKLQRAFGTLEITSDPANLEYTLRAAGAAADAAPLQHGRTPARFDDVMPDDYLVTFARAGWSEHAVAVSVPKDGRVSATTSYQGGSVTFASTPQGAQVLLDGAVVGVTPFKLTDLKPQKVRYEFSLPGYERVTLGDQIAEGTNLTLNALMLPLNRLASTREVRDQPRALAQVSPVIVADTPPGSMASITFVVDRDGKAHDFIIEKSTDDVFARACLAAVKQWRFAPAVNFDGQPVNIRVSVPFTLTRSNSRIF